MSVWSLNNTTLAFNWLLCQYTVGIHMFTYAQILVYMWALFLKVSHKSYTKYICNCKVLAMSAVIFFQIDTVHTNVYEGASRIAR